MKIPVRLWYNQITKKSPRRVVFPMNQENVSPSEKTLIESEENFMKKKIRSVLTLGLTAILLIIGVLGVALGSHYVEYYGIGTNPLPKLTEEDIESMYVQLSIPVGATYFVRERTLTKEETAEIIERYNTLDADFLGCSPSAKPLNLSELMRPVFF